MGLFTSKKTEQVAAVRAKLDAAQMQLAAAEDEARGDAALAAVLSDDAEAAMAPVRDRLRRARDQVELCEAALETAQRLERKRVAEAADAAEKARIRSITQHAAKAASHGAKLGELIAETIEEYSKMLGVINKAERLLRPDELRHLFGSEPIVIFARNAFAMEMRRVQAKNPGSFLPVDARITERVHVRHGVAVSDWTPLSEVIRARLNIGVALRPAPAPVVEEEPVDAMAEYHARGEAAVAAYRQRDAEENRQIEESPADAVARYRAEVAKIESNTGVASEPYRDWDEGEEPAEVDLVAGSLEEQPSQAEPPVEITADQLALAALIDAPPAPVSAGAAGLKAIAARRERNNQ